VQIAASSSLAASCGSHPRIPAASRSPFVCFGLLSNERIQLEENTCWVALDPPHPPFVHSPSPAHRLARQRTTRYSQIRIGGSSTRLHSARPERLRTERFAPDAIAADGSATKASGGTEVHQAHVLFCRSGTEGVWLATEDQTLLDLARAKGSSYLSRAARDTVRPANVESWRAKCDTTSHRSALLRRATRCSVVRVPRHRSSCWMPRPNAGR
jgi:hypothetical protein